jgi:DNA-binding transcriptional MerR regulator
MAQLELMTTADVAKQCGVTPAAVRWWVRRGQLVADVTTPGGQRLYRRATIARLIAHRCKAAESAPSSTSI